VDSPGTRGKRFPLLRLAESTAKLNKTSYLDHTCSTQGKANLCWESLNQTPTEVEFLMIHILPLLQQELDAVIQLHQNYQNQIQELQEQVSYLEMVIHTMEERIAELECLQNLYSPDGDALCNSL
jgi:peptidoglycan hydrolase CwlO-like protein